MSIYFRVAKTLAALLVIIFCFHSGIIAQNSIDTLRKGAAKIFIDCQSCDMNYTRQQIPYVNYVRDVKEAQVYILVSSQHTGSGGHQYTFKFQGQYEYEGMSDTLVLNTNPDETSTITREKKTKIMKMGLMRYVARTPVFNEIEIKHNAALEEEQVIDKWNNWVFEISSSPRYMSEESAKRLTLENALTITRITPDFKLEMELNQDIFRRRYIDEEENLDTTYKKSDNSFDVLLVKSLGEHWSAGIKWDNGSSTEENYNYFTEILPTIEYNLFKYSESTHRQLRFLYSIGYQYADYIDSTIYDKTKEDFFKHELRIAYQVQEKWGSINVSLTGENLISDPSKYGVNLFGNVRLRLIKGLSLSIYGGASYNNYQPNLRKGEISEADRLLQLKQLASSYFVQGGLSLTYTFGSIYNNVVNPRFRNSGGGGGGGGFYY